MLIIPAVDIRQGQCVRLFQGKFDEVTVFFDDPVQMAMQWVKLGANYLHIVDLDGAETGRVVNMVVINEIAQRVSVPCELGGGLRDSDMINTVLQLGIDRVILGTAALEKPELIDQFCKAWPGRIVVGIDARNGFAASHGWTKVSTIKATDLARDMEARGVSRIIYTDIERDGTMTQPNFAAIEEMVKNVSIPIIASGGVSCIDHIKSLMDTGAEAVIIGRALYEGKLSLPEAICLAEGRQVC